jgi:Nucleotide-diphospho-sugar transferase
VLSIGSPSSDRRCLPRPCRISTSGVLSDLVPSWHGLVSQGREKINLIHAFTKMGFTILVSDVDTVWMQNPLPFMERYPSADILASSDLLVSPPCGCPAFGASISGFRDLGFGIGSVISDRSASPASKTPLLVSLFMVCLIVGGA